MLLSAYKECRCRLLAASIDKRLWFRREICRFGANYVNHAKAEKVLKLDVKSLSNLPAWV